MGRSLFRCLISLLYQREGCDSRWCCLRRHFVGLDAGCPRRICENDMAGIYSKQKNPLFDALLLSGRTRFGPGGAGYELRCYPGPGKFPERRRCRKPF